MSVQNVQKWSDTHITLDFQGTRHECFLPVQLAISELRKGI